MLRREVVKMGGGLFGLGKPSPSRFPYPGRPQPAPGVAPSPGIVVRARQVIVFGPTGTPVGFFLYRAGTTPALGNPPVAWITQSNADPFGNVLPTAPGSGAVATVNNAGTRVSQLTQGAILMGLVADFTEGSLSPQSGEWIMFSPTVSGVDTPGAFHLDSVLSPTGNGATPQLKLFNGTVINADGAAVPVTGGLSVTGGTTTDTLTATGQVTATAGTAASPTKITNDVWHTVGAAGEPTFGAGFAAGSPVPRFRLWSDNTVRLSGRVAVTAAVVSGATVFTLPAGPPSYRPVQTCRYLLANTLSGYTPAAGSLPNSFFVASTGAVQISAAGANGNVFDIEGTIIPLD